jgi:large repetitive protein
MNMRKRFIVLTTFALVCSSFASAQDVFTFVAGKKTHTATTGDILHQYDYWIKPSHSSKSVILQIFDAGLGGVADVITGAADIKTTFQIFLYDSLNNGKPLQSLVTGNEQKYINRWCTLVTLDPKTVQNGWILRVSAGDGDDANAFKLNLVDNKGMGQLGKGWVIYSYELPLCLYGVSENAEVQFRAHPSFAGKRTELQSFGEEQSTVYVSDLFGQTSRLPVEKDFLQSTIAEIKNMWGLSVTGSSMRINNMVVRSKTNSAVIWEWMPRIVQKPKKPTISIMKQAGVNCNSVRLSLSEQTRREAPDVSPSWVIGKTRLSGDSALVEFPKAGTYIAQVLIPSTGVYHPLYWLDNFTITVNAPPAAVISGAKNIVSPGDELLLSSKDSRDPEGSPLRVQWFINSESRGNQPDLHFSSLIPGLYEVRLIVNDGAANSMCTEAEDSKTIRVNAQPYAEISGPKIHGRKANTKFFVKNDFDTDNDKLFFTWSGTGIVGPSNDRSVVVNHDIAGDYSITLSVDDHTGSTNSTYTAQFNYHVNAEPVPLFALTEQAAPGDQLVLNASNTNDPDSKNLSFHWSLSNGSKYEGKEAKFTFDAPGDYKVTLTVDDGEGVENSIQSIRKSIHINAPPVPLITAVDHSTSARQLISAEKSHDADQKALQYSWDLGDGSTGSGKSIEHVFQKSGRYTITLTVDDGQKQTNSIQSTIHLLVINKYPVAQFSIPAKWETEKALVVNGTKSYDPDGLVSKYTWLINGKEIAGDSISSLTFPEPGDYAVALKVRDNSGFDDAIGIQTASIHINYPPIIKWKTSPAVTEPNESVTFDAKGSYDPDGKIKSVTWKFSDSTEYTGMKVTKVFKKSGSMGVKIIADDGAGFSNSVQSKDFTLLVNNQPIIVTKTFIRSNSQTVLLDASQSYDIDGQALKFDWLLSDGTHRHDASFYWEAKKGGVHFITLTVDDGLHKKNSIARESIRLIVNRPPVAVVDSIIYSCTGMTILLNGSLSYDPDGDPMTTLWQFGDGTSSTETNPAHVFTRPGFYSVKLTLSDGFADQPTTATIPVIIEGSPQAFQSFSDTTICVNAPLIFDGTRSSDPNGPLGSYAWDFGDGLNALGSNVTHAYSRPGTYYVTLTVIGNGSGRCSKVNQATSTIHVVEGPTADFTLPDAVSIGEEVMVDASASRANGKILSTTWTARSGDIVLTREGTQTKFTFEKSGLYAIQLTISIETSTTCNSSSTMKNIIVNAPPVLVWSVSKEIGLGDQLVMDGSKSYDPDGIIKEFLWTLDGEKIGHAPIVTLPMAVGGKHIVGLRITDNSRTSSRSVEQTMALRVNSKPDPIITIQDPVYETEPTKLEPGKLVDSDNDTLRFIWKIDGHVYAANTITFLPGRHSVTLIADDGRGLKNSIDSVQKDISVIPKPDLKSIDVPRNWLIGANMNINEVTTLPNVGFINNQAKEDIWTAQTSGDQIISIGWSPRNVILTQEKFQIHVWPHLVFENPPGEKTITWNPSNPSIVLTAPDVNRPDTRKVSYEWRKGETLIGHGKVIAAPLNAGTNTFNVRVIDQDMVGAQPVVLQIVVRCK